LEKPHAKVPFFSGMKYNQINPAVSGKYLTLWPIHPAPLHFRPEDYFKIVSMSVNVPESISKLYFKDPRSETPVKIM